jgi:beta-galactosidase
VTVTSATATDGRRLRFVHNWSWDTVGIDLPNPVHDVLADTTADGKLTLGPWDVRVLAEPTQHP